MNIVIIEDEQMTAEDLILAIRGIRPEYNVVKVLTGVKEAVSWFRANPAPGLIFSDVQLSDGISFDIFRQVEVKAPIIFCTAYDTYAIEAFRINGIAYILKPFNPLHVRQAIEKFELLAQPSSSTIVKLIEMFDQKSRTGETGALLVHHKDKIIPIRLEEAAVFYIHHEAATVFTFDGRTFSLNESLDELEQRADSSFFRASRQHLVHRKAVKDVSHYFGRKLLINLSVPFTETITVSKEKSPAFLEWLANS